MEHQWMKAISSATICNFFYFFFVVYAVIFALSVLVTIGVVGAFKMKGAVGLALGAQAMITAALGGTMMLFYYLICDRALLAGAAKGVVAEGFAQAAPHKRM